MINFISSCQTIRLLLQVGTTLFDIFISFLYFPIWDSCWTDTWKLGGCRFRDLFERKENTLLLHLVYHWLSILYSNWINTERGQWSICGQYFRLRVRSFPKVSIRSHNSVYISISVFWFLISNLVIRKKSEMSYYDLRHPETPFEKKGLRTLKSEAAIHLLCVQGSEMSWFWSLYYFALCNHTAPNRIWDIAGM